MPPSKWASCVGRSTPSAGAVWMSTPPSRTSTCVPTGRLAPCSSGMSWPSAGRRTSTSPPSGTALKVSPATGGSGGGSGPPDDTIAGASGIGSRLSGMITGTIGSVGGCRRA